MATATEIRARWENRVALKVRLERRAGGIIDHRDVGAHDPLDAEEAAAILRVTARTVHRLVTQGCLAGRRQGPRVVTTLADIVRYIEDRLDAAAARRALEEMQRRGTRPIPYERVRRELGLA